MRYYRLRSLLPTKLEHAIHAMREPAHTLKLLKKRGETRRKNLHYPNATLLVAGLPKSGTTWVENFLFHVPGYIPRRLGGDIETQIQHNLQKDSFSHFPADGYSFVKTHTNPSLDNFMAISNAGIRRTLVLVRDPADAAVSRYYYLLANPKGKHEPNYIDYREMSQEDALQHSLQTIAEHFLPWIDGWYEYATKHPEQFLVMRYEDLRQDPVSTFERISNFYQLSLARYQVEEILRLVDTQMKSRSLQASGSAGIKSTFRRGVSGEAKELFLESVLRDFYANCSSSIRALGYGVSVKINANETL